jgi:leucyl aminopeptidase (aminopeptidase T)
MKNLGKLLIDVFNPQKGENVVILNDFPSSEPEEDFLLRQDMADEWHNSFSKLAKELSFTIEPVITYEPTGTHSAPLPKTAKQGDNKIDLNERLSKLEKKDIVIAITKYSATGPLHSLMKKQQFRSATLPGVLPSMSALEADHKLIAKKAKVLKAKLDKANAAVATFSTGHEVYFDFRGREARMDAGICHKPGDGINLPTGEVFIALFDEDGSKTKGYIPVEYERTQVIFEVQQNKITDVISDSPKARQMIKYFHEDPARANIAEFGLGCNDKAVFINNILQDEKIEGMHWAYGYNKYMGGTVDVSDFKFPEEAVHMDHIYTKQARIKVHRIELVYEDKSREVIMENSRYSFKIRKEFEE